MIPTIITKIFKKSINLPTITITPGSTGTSNNHNKTQPWHVGRANQSSVNIPGSPSPPPPLPSQVAFHPLLSSLAGHGTPHSPFLPLPVRFYRFLSVFSLTSLLSQSLFIPLSSPFAFHPSTHLSFDFVSFSSILMFLIQFLLLFPPARLFLIFLLLSLFS